MGTACGVGRLGWGVLKQFADRWALVTGASSGIGAEFARQLAARGMHLVLAARRRDLMEQLAEELHTRHGTRSEIIAVDLSDLAGSGRLMEEIARRNLQIELLVNNAGFGIVGEVDQADRERILQMLRVNVLALTDLTYRVLPGMLERGQGAVINVSSVAAFQPVVYLGAYAASKSYVLHFSESLAAEVAERGVTILAFCPGPTQTAFFEVAGVPGWLKKRATQTPEQVVKACLRAVEKRRQYVIPGWRDYLRTAFVRIGTRKRVVNESKRYFRPRRKKDQK